MVDSLRSKIIARMSGFANSDDLRNGSTFLKLSNKRVNSLSSRHSGSIKGSKRFSSDHQSELLNMHP